MALTVRETERKYGAADGVRLPDPAAVTGVAAAQPGGVTALDARYYDTADRRLAADGLTLRRRTGGTDPGWHLKLPVGPDVRDEIRAPLADTLPPELAALVRSRVRGAALVPVVRLRTRRTVTVLTDAAGAPLAELAYDEVRAERPDGARASWHEVEAELAPGAAPELLDALDAWLRGAGLTPGAYPSKLARALAATERARPGGPEASREAGTGRGSGAPGATAGDTVLTYLGEQFRALVALDPAVRRELPDAVHRMRVATRRARGVLRSYRRLLDRTATDPVVAELSWLAGELGIDRDREVLTARIGDGVAALPRELRVGPVRTRVRSWSRPRRGAARRLTAVLDGHRYLTLLDTLDRLLADPPLRPAAARAPRKELLRAVRKDFRRLSRRMCRALETPPGPERDRALHEARKAAKRFRYGAEAARPALGRTAARCVRRATALQDVLGEHHDTVVTREALRELADRAHTAGESAFTYGLLHGRQEARAAACEERLPRLWKKAGKQAPPGA
ncbi:CYTH and CHAD domain-containing protein [Streptomyces catenulae]|uniref:CYTH and CHAD domain-containing protein n=1 Tax=Streptomyces catenulae TaxID=66875 RepID=A0ABV2YY50_9ACTN|nr:CYTH and CHAD domain-containing protein [Streptomyces catenulae]